MLESWQAWRKWRHCNALLGSGGSGGGGKGSAQRQPEELLSVHSTAMLMPLFG